jgi:L-iditol 2-dehydrogenase
MRAVELQGRERLKLVDIPESPLETGEVRVRVKAALTCGTDLKVYRRGGHPRMLKPPCLFGHEFSGEIVEVQDPESSWRVGDRVVAANSAPCGMCQACLRDQENLCDNLLFLNGAYAESIVVPARIVSKNLLRLQPTTDWADAALTEPLACVMLGIQELSLVSGESLLILGSGPIGLMALVLAKSLGVEVTLVGRGESRLQRAEHLGARHCVDMAGREDVVTAVRDAGYPGCRSTGTGAVADCGYDAVFEAVGKPSTWEAALALVRSGGRINWFGGCPVGTTISLDTTRMHYGSLSLKASFHHTPKTIRNALQTIEAGTVSAQDFVDGTTSLEALPEVFQSMAQGNRAIKTQVLFP